MIFFSSIFVFAQQVDSFGYIPSFADSLELDSLAVVDTTIIKSTEKPESAIQDKIPYKADRISISPNGNLIYLNGNAQNNVRLDYVSICVNYLVAQRDSCYLSKAQMSISETIIQHRCSSTSFSSCTPAPCSLIIHTFLALGFETGSFSQFHVNAC